MDTQEDKKETEVTPTEEVKESPISYRDQVNSLYKEKNGQEAKEDIITDTMPAGKDMNKIILIITAVVVVIFIGIYLYKNTGLLRFAPKKEEEVPLSERIDSNKTYGLKVTKTLATYKLPEIVSGTCTTAEESGITWNYCLDSEGNALNVFAMNSLYKDVEIPSKLDGHKVISVGMRNSNRQFGLCGSNVNCKGIVTVVIPDGVEYIESFFLMNSTSIEEVTIPDSVKYIGDYAFYNAQNIMKINSKDVGTFKMPSSLEYYGVYLFAYNKYVSNFEFPESIDYINQYTFQHCTAIRKLVIDGQYKYILPGAFSDSKITSLEVKDGVYVLSGFANNDDLKEVVIADSVKYIYEKTFANDHNISTFKYDGKLYYLGSSIFSGTKIDVNSFLTMKNIDLYFINETTQEELARIQREKEEKEEREKQERLEELRKKQAEEDAKKEKEKEENTTCDVTDEECISRLYGD